jgi:hypothetical protein
LRGRKKDLDLIGLQRLAARKHLRFGRPDIVQGLKSIEDRLRDGNPDLSGMKVAGAGPFGVDP